MYGAALPFNLLGRAPGVRQIRANRIDFIGNEPVPAQADGDPAGRHVLSVTDAAGPIQVVIGIQDKPSGSACVTTTTTSNSHYSR